MSSSTEVITVAARGSLLSRKQVEEVYAELRCFHPDVMFELLFVDTLGDGDQQISLRSLEKTDFFTREIDALLLKSSCRAAIHSAKDLPEPLPQGLMIAAVTKGVDPSDVLVFRAGGHLDTLPSPAKIGSSSARRDAAVRKIVPHALYLDLRGTIESRLAQLDAYKYDAIVMAEAALIRLGLCHRSRFRLPGSSAPLQGKLSVVIRETDWEMKQLFACLDAH